METRRTPDETFYFDHFELVIDPGVLPEHYPEVTYIDGESVVATVLSDDGKEFDQNVVARHDFAPGDQILEIVATNGRTRESMDGGRWAAIAEGDVVSSYSIMSNDILLLQNAIEHDGEVILARADQPLPQREDGRTWRPLGIMTTEGKLITWHGISGQARNLVEYCVASWVVRPDSGMGSATDCRNLLHEFRSGRSLLASVEGDNTVRTYLWWFFDQFAGIDFRPVQEPKDAWRPRVV